ncbi:MAG TPA: hypothetical protein VGQ39_21180 [Pyrinomonadaceae bacterium]|nr:hypothetical protein [Pyrinomonadaceae bacterium]
MNHAARNVRGLKPAMIAELLFVGTAIWQFYLFVSFKDAKGVFDLQGGYGHLLIAVFVALLACVTGFFIFSVLLRRDREDELHITSIR